MQCTIHPVTDTICSSYTIDDYISDLENFSIHLDAPTYSLSIGEFHLPNDVPVENIESLLTSDGTFDLGDEYFDGDIWTENGLLSLSSFCERNGSQTSARFSSKSQEESRVILDAIVEFMRSRPIAIQKAKEKHGGK